MDIKADRNIKIIPSHTADAAPSFEEQKPEVKLGIANAKDLVETVVAPVVSTFTFGADTTTQPGLASEIASSLGSPAAAIGSSAGEKAPESTSPPKTIRGRGPDERP